MSADDRSGVTWHDPCGDSATVDRGRLLPYPQERKGVRLGFPKIRAVFQALSLSRILLKENLT
jgi:hypothetical protein